MNAVNLNQRTTVLMTGAQDFVAGKLVMAIMVAGTGVAGTGLAQEGQPEEKGSRAPILRNVDTVKVPGQATGRAVRHLTVLFTKDAVRPSTTKRTSLLKKRDPRVRKGHVIMPPATSEMEIVQFRARKCTCMLETSPLK